MLTILLIVLLVLLIAGWSGNHYRGWYTGDGVDAIWLVVAVLVIFLALRLVGII